MYSEQQLLGLEKYDKMFRNRMYLNVMYHSYMYATAYHTGYNRTTMNEICNPEKLKTSACWGPCLLYTSPDYADFKNPAGEQLMPTTYSDAKYKRAADATWERCV